MVSETRAFNSLYWILETTRVPLLRRDFSNFQFFVLDSTVDSNMLNTIL